MIRNLTYITTISLALAFTVYCGKTKDKDSVSEGVELSQDFLNGEWRSTCDLSSGVATDVIFEFSDEKITFERNIYDSRDNKNCKSDNLLAIVRQTKKYRFIKQYKLDQNLIPGSRKIEYYHSSPISVQPTTFDAVSLFKREEICGLKEWSKNGQIILPGDCSEILGIELYEERFIDRIDLIFSKTGSYIQFGRLTETASLTEKPSKLYKSRYFKNIKRPLTAKPSPSPTPPSQEESNETP